MSAVLVIINSIYILLKVQYAHVLSTQWYAAGEVMDRGASSGERAGFQLFTLKYSDESRYR